MTNNRWTQQDLEKLKNFVRSSNYIEGEKLIDRLHKLASEYIGSVKKVTSIINEKDSLLALSLLAEALDQRRKAGEAMALIEKVAACINDKISVVASMGKVFPDESVNHKQEEQRIWRQRIWLVMNYCHLLLQKGRLKEALEYLDKTEMVVQLLLDEEENSATWFPLYGTRARCNYFKALIYHACGQPTKAERCSTDSLIFFFKRLEKEEIEHQNDPNRIIRERAFALHCMGRVEAFCKARIERTRARIKRALQKIQAAELLLRDMNSDFMADILLCEKGIARMDLAGYDVTKLKEAGALLRRSCDNLYNEGTRKDGASKDSDHKDGYYLRALVEYALSRVITAIAVRHLQSHSNAEYERLLDEGFLKKGEYDELLDEAEKASEAAIALAKEKYILSWRALWVLCRAYLERDYISGARNYSKEALKEAKETGNHYGEWLVSITMADIDLREATIRRGVKSDEERSSLISNAVSTYRDNRIKVADEAMFLKAYCTLRLVKAYLDQKNLSMAFEEFSLWTDLYSQKVENEWLHEQARTLKEKLDSQRRPFIIEAKEVGNAKFSEFSDRLKDWLIAQAQIKLREQGEVPNSRNIAGVLKYNSHASIVKKLGKKRRTPTNDK